MFVAVLPDGVYTAKAGGAIAEIPFSTSAIGSVPVYVAGEGGGFSLLSYEAGLASQSVSIDSFSLPNTLISGKEAIARANVSALQYPSDITLVFTFGSQSGQAVGRISSPASFEFPFTPDAPGTYPASLAAKAGGTQSVVNQVSTVLLQPVLSVDSVKNIYSNGTLYTQVSFTAAGSPISPSASVSGSSYSAGSPITLALPIGKNTLHLSWSDPAGNAYSSDEEIMVAQPSMLDAVASPQGCPLASALLFTVLIFSASSARACKSKV